VIVALVLATYAAVKAQAGPLFDYEYPFGRPFDVDPPVILADTKQSEPAPQSTGNGSQVVTKQSEPPHPYTGQRVETFQERLQRDAADKARKQQEAEDNKGWNTQMLYRRTVWGR
jgi:hypothetical protein